VPDLSADVVEAYQSKKNVSADCAIEDHPHLLSGALRPIFDAFRKAVLALDPCVNEDFLKLYVAYKSETNFVDIVPQAKRLVVALNMRFSEVSDPRGLCRDVSGKGRWGNGALTNGGLKSGRATLRARFGATIA